MAENDEPLDDLRAVGMTAAAAAARVAETVLRDQQQKAQQAQQQEIQRREAVSSVATLQPVYDSPHRRAEADAGMKSAGVADEVRQAKSTADLLNGANPQYAAAGGSKASPQGGAPVKLPEKQRIR